MSSSTVWVNPGIPALVSGRIPVDGSGVTQPTSPGRYDVTPAARADGAVGPIETDVNGRALVYLSTQIAGEDLPNNVLGMAAKPVIGAAYSWSFYRKFGDTISGNVKATAGQLGMVRVTNRSAVVKYLILANSTGSLATVRGSWEIPAGTTNLPGLLELGVDNLGPNGENFDTGISFGISTTNGSYVAGTAADHNVSFRYV